MKKPISNIETLLAAGFIEPEKLPILNKVAEQFSVAITPQMAELLSKEDPKHPVNLQFIPNEKELEIQAHELADPIGDEKYSPVKGVVHRHPDRCLFKVIQSCPVYCRFCFRREQLGHHTKMLSDTELEQAFHYITDSTGIWEVILTGGDPLMLNPKKLKMIVERLTTIAHVEVIRIHTRVPVVDSKRINTKLLDALQTEKALFMALHANHPAEFTQEAEQAIRRIIQSGIPMLSQSVLLKGINDEPETLRELMKRFVKNRIKPYYLHHGDLARGTAQFRTTIEVGQMLMRSLRRDTSGLCQATYVIDIPGGYGKIPLHSNYVQGCQNQGYVLEDVRGESHIYPPPAK